jgi:hypothetical protein
LDPGTPFYVIFIPVFAVLAFLIGTAIAFIAMSNRAEPPEEDSQPAH